MKILLTGGAGFIGSAVVREIIRHTPHEVVNVDCLAYAGNPASLAGVSADPRHVLEQADITDAAAMTALFERHRPDAVMHLAAETHVDRSLDDPAVFLRTNVLGTGTLLEVARAWWERLPTEKRDCFRFHHVSTDEVYGDLAMNAAPFTESSPYAPSSPYAASKAGSDHLVRAWHRSYGLPVVLSHCSNNYGPCQFPEKLVPHMILSALHGKPLPVYGDGLQRRDWLYVEDHAHALLDVLAKGRVGETYNIGGHNEQGNLQVVEAICELLDELAAGQRPASINHYRDLITFVQDRPGHDLRYAMDAGKIGRELGWQPRETFASGLRKTVQWYLSNPDWWQRVLDGRYRLERLGV